MANYNKSFNFRNGVQVDNDNFVVNANGLVGIGTTILQDYILNVVGDVRVVGLVTADNINSKNVNISGISTLSILNVGITSISSGIITASSGVVTYYGDGSQLSNIPTSKWFDTIPGIYAPGPVGIATTIASFSLQIGSNPLVYPTGIGINSEGHVYSNGIVTATSFTGIGSNLISLNASNISLGTLNNSRLPANVSISGVITAGSFSGSGAGITAINASNILSGTISTTVFPSNIVVSGVITASSFIGNLTGTATSALNLSNSASINVLSVNSGFSTVGVSTVFDTLHVIGKIGVGTAVPDSDIDVCKSGVSSIRVLSDTNQSIIGIGRSAEIRTGNTNSFYSYSPANSLDILNFNSGGVNFYLDYGTAGLGTGNFNWIYGQNPSNPLLTLTYGGNLGLGITNPPSKLYVVGSSYLDGITTVGSNLNVTNNLSITGNLSFNGSITGNLGITTLARLGISTSTISSNTYEFFVGGDPVLGKGVYVTAGGDIRSSNQIIANNLSSSGVSTLGGVVISSGIITTTGVDVVYYGNAEKLKNLTGVSSNTYGSPISIPQITVDENGRITSISNINVSAAAGGGVGFDVYRNGITNYIGFASAVNFSTDFSITGINTLTGITTISVLTAQYAPLSGVATYATSAGIATYATNAGLATYATSAGIATYATNAGLATYATSAGIATYATSAGIATYASTSGVSTNVIGGLGSLNQIIVSGISTFTNGPVLIGSGTSTGITTQRLQVTGGVYVSDSIGIGTTNPKGALDIVSTTQPFYLPRMTTAQRNGMSNVSVGAMIYNLSTNEFEGYGSTGWITLGV